MHEVREDNPWAKLKLVDYLPLQTRKPYTKEYYDHHIEICLMGTDLC